MTVVLRAERASGSNGGGSLDRRCFSMTFRCCPPLLPHAPQRRACAALVGRVGELEARVREGRKSVCTS